jgi:putative acetyltransferase
MNEIIEIRPIKPMDNDAIKSIIKNALIEFDSDKPGTAFFDKSLENLYEAYQNNRAIYFVALLNGKLIGGCGIDTLENADTNICELQKMYLSPEARGKKIGKKLLVKCLNYAKEANYKQCYLESFPYMISAINLYLENGFKKLDKPLGNTGHTACDVHMLLDLNNY